jgi:hypothetical protein
MPWNKKYIIMYMKLRGTAGLKMSQRWRRDQFYRIWCNVYFMAELRTKFLPPFSWWSYEFTMKVEAQILQALVLNLRHFGRQRTGKFTVWYFFYVNEGKQRKTLFKISETGDFRIVYKTFNLFTDIFSYHYVKQKRQFVHAALEIRLVLLLECACISAFLECSTI